MKQVKTLNGWNIWINTAGGACWVEHHANVDPHGLAWAKMEDRKFIGRFKYHRPTANARHFVKFLTAYFTPDEYLSRLEAGETPMGILRSRGYRSLNELAAAKL